MNHLLIIDVFLALVVFGFLRYLDEIVAVLLSFDDSNTELFEEFE